MSDERRKLQPGRRLNLPDRASSLERRLRDPGSSLRQSLDNFLANRRIEPANENIDTNTLVGAGATFVVFVLEDYLPVRGGASTDIVEANEMEGGDVIQYVVDTNAPIEGQARLKSLLTTGTGFSSLWIDEFEIKDFKVVRERPLRDTYRYEIEVQMN